MYVEKTANKPKRWNDTALDSMGRALQKMQGLTRAASAGGFAVNEAGGQAMLAAVRTCREEIDAQRANLAKIKQPPQLGNTPGAQQVAQHDQRSATGDVRSLESVIEKATQALDEFATAVRQAMANYHDAEAGNRTALRGSYRG
jgi:hypothetical protein